MVDVFIPIAIIAFLIVVNGFFVAAEFAIAAAPHTRVAQMAADGSDAARHVLDILRDPDLLNRYISTAQVGITIASLGLGMYGERVIAHWLLHPLESWGGLGVAAAHTVATIIAVGFLTYLHVVLGEMIPKSLALQSAARAAVVMSSAMSLSERIFRPLTAVLNWIGDRLLRLAGLPNADTHAQLSSSEELAYIVEESSESGLLEPTELLYLENVFDFHERTLGQVMTPRTRMVGIPIDADRKSTLAQVCATPHSRYPVYESDRDHIVGILYIKDLARHLAESETDAFDLRSLVREATYAPETVSLETMLARFRQEHVQIAVVLDEYGGTAGVITLEDLVEELIGEIQDEFDREVAPMRDLGGGQLRVRGDLLLAELSQHYDVEMDQEEADTVGGLVMNRLGQIPRQGDSVESNGVRFTVESVEGLAVKTLIVTLPEDTAQDNAPT